MRRRRPVRPIVVVAAVALLAGAAVPAVAAPAPAALTTVMPAVTPSSIGTYSFIGHGWGHGRGMGQYGALGYALNSHWTYAAILAHYYGGTTAAPDAADPNSRSLDVELTARTGTDTAATGTSLMLDQGTGAKPVLMPDGVTPARTVSLKADGTGRFAVRVAATECASGGPLVPLTTTVPSGTVITTVPSGAVISDGAGQAITQCGDTQEQTYRGALVAKWTGSTPYTFNRVPVEQYLRDVVPHESPAGWGSLGTLQPDGQPWGMEALKAQSVAARSYALSSSRPSGATTCDTTACQVYMPYATRSYATPSWTTAGWNTLPYPQSDQAVVLTAGQVLRTSSGAIARTEFSSSTGGYTAGGAFPAVEDLGDAITGNPNHTWTVSLTAAQVAARLGLSGVTAITITNRNGLGDLGGRVLSLTVIDASGVSRAYTGAQFQAALGLNSDWFAVSGVTPGQAQAVVQSLYQDVLGRGPDPQGLVDWTAVVQVAGNGQAVANGIVYSRERLITLVTAEYQAALHRNPEPTGLDAWVQVLAAGAGVSDLEIGIYASQESLMVLGGGDTATWVGAMYASILGRPAAPSEATAWAQVAQKYGRAAAVSGIAKSNEAGLLRLSAYYQQFLGRGLDASGIASWLPYMSGAGDFLVPGFIGGSIEYWSRAQTRFPS